MLNCYNPSPANIVPSSADITPHPGMFDCFTLLLFDRFPNKLAPNVLNSIPRNPPLCSFTSFLIFLLTPFINKPDSSRDLTIS